MRRGGLDPSESDTLGQFTANGPWLLIFAGTTWVGRRRASAFVEYGLGKAWDALMFDGYADQDLPDGIPGVTYARQEANSLPARMAGISTAGRSKAVRVGRTIIRRMGTFLRPFWGWRLLRRSIRGLRSGVPPVAIAYCDDTAIPQAWHAARIWTDVPVVARPSDL